MYSDEETVNLLTNKTKHSRMLWLSYHSLIQFLEINHSRRSKYNRRLNVETIKIDLPLPAFLKNIGDYCNFP
jgi:hypothetical protein